MRFAASLAAVLFFAQAPAAAQTASLYQIKPLRWDEDYSFLKDPALSQTAPKFKYVGLGSGENYVSFGSEARYRVEAYENPLFGKFGAEDFVSNNLRLLGHADVHLGSDARIFVQLGAFAEDGRKPAARSVDESGLDLTQAFVDLGSDNLRVRLGRQELPFGRFVSLRDGTNLRRTLDGIRVDGKLSDTAILAFAAAPTRNFDDSFDDDPNPDDFAWGISATRDGWSLVYFGREDENARFTSGTGHEERHTLAIRNAGSAASWRWDVQTGVQFGSLETPVRTLDIEAFGIASEFSRAFDLPGKPRAAIRLDAASGDGNAADTTLGTFDLGFPNLSYLSDAAAIAPRNVIDVHPFVTITPHKDVTLTGGAEFVWRFRQGDAVYAPPALPLTPAVTSGGAYAATQMYVRAQWRPSQHWELSVSAVQIEPGPALSDAGGQAQTFGSFQTTLRY